MIRGVGTIKGEKIKCEGHRVEKPQLCVQSDGHHGKCVIVKHGKCKVIKAFKWMKYNS